MKAWKSLIENAFLSLLTDSLLLINHTGACQAGCSNEVCSSRNIQQSYYCTFGKKENKQESMKARKKGSIVARKKERKKENEYILKILA